MAKGRNQGELESAVLNVLWTAREGDSANLTSQQVLAALSPDGSLALTTVLTVLARLADKGLVIKSAGEGRQLLFSSATTREEHDAGLLLKVFAESANPLLAFSHFAKSLTPEQLNQIKSSLNRN